MSPCADAQTLEQLISGALSAEQAQQIQDHLNGCSRCQGLLDRRYEHAELRQWALKRESPQMPLPERALLDELLEEMYAAPPPSQLASDAGASGDEFVDVLSPPTHANDLGMLDPYRIVRLLGQGAMGRVFLAQDTNLQRPVALKVLRPEHVSAEARARFAREARVVGELEHDHVVAVHAVALTANGLPYLVMQYVDGPTLRERIKAEERLAPHEAARICLQVAEGLAAAHAKGLVHCDIKPGNIILEKATGRAKIVDFGLGRRTELSDGITQHGATVGTPEYMSPEQLRDPKRVDVRSDIYSLGVTLYQALTGDVPFRGVLHMIQQQILHDEPRPPRRLNDRIPRDLETICLKSLAKEPARRYQSARDLADELRRFLERKPIKARPLGPGRRLWRWCRRKPTVASLTTAVVLAVAGGAGGGLWQWQQAEEERRVEKTNLQRIHQTLNAILSELTDPQFLEQDPREVRQRILSVALPPFRQLLDQRPTEPQFQHDQGQTFLRLALMNWQMGSWGEAMDFNQHAQAVLAELVNRYPNVPDYRGSWADSLDSLSRLYHDVGRLPEAEQACQNALAILEELTRDCPGVAAHQARLARARYGLGRIFQSLDRVEEAQRNCEDALDRLATLARDHPEMEEYRLDLASSHYHLGVLKQIIGQTQPAEANYAAAYDRQRELVEKHPGVTRYQAESAKTLASLGLLFLITARLDRAEGACQAALAIQKRLAEKYPTMPQYLADLARTYQILSSLCRYNGQAEEAEQASRDAVTLHRALVDLQAALAREHPNIPQFQAGLALSYVDLSRVCRETGQLDEADRAGQDGLVLQQALVRDYPMVPQYRADLARSHNSRAHRLTQLKRVGEAEQARREALAIQRALVREYPAIPRYQADLARTWGHLGHLFRNTERLEDAEPALQEGLRIGQVLADKYPGVIEYRLDLARHYHAVATLALMRDRKEEEAEDLYKIALAIRQTLARAYPGISEYQGDLAAGHQALGTLYGRIGEKAKAELAYREALGVLELLVRQLPMRLEYKRDLGRVQFDLGKLADRAETALSWLEEAIATLEPVVAAPLPPDQARDFLDEARRERAHALTRLRH